MAKKRKSVSTPVARIKEIKSETSDSPIKSPPSSPDVMDVTNPASTSATELVTARGKLKSVLQVLFDQSDESSESIPREDRPTPQAPPPKVVIKKEKTQSLTPSSRLAGRKKRRRMQAAEQAFHHTYVMKLFDRSVDLAQFKEYTPLYPICRAWMANQPRNTNLGARVDSPSPEPVEEEEPETTEEGITPDGEERVKKTYKMPPPIPLPTDPVLCQQLKIPTPIIVERSKDIDLDAEVKPTREHMLQEHVAHWIAVRKKWHSTGHKNEERFAESAQILKNIFKRAQRAFE